MEPYNASKENLARIGMLIIIVIWGLNAPVMKIGLMSLSPMVYNACRLIIAATLLLLILLITRSYKPMPGRDLVKVAILGIVGFFLNQLFVMFGVFQTTAGNSSLVLATLPVEVALINRLFNLESISRRMTAGIAIGLLGVLFIVLGSNKEFSFLGPHLLGALLLLLGQLCYAYYTVFVKDLNNQYSIYQIYTYVIVLNAGLFVLVSLPELLYMDWSMVSDTVWYSIIFSSAFALVLANVLWIWIVGELGSTKASVSQYLCPVVSIAFVWAYLNETFGLIQFIGAFVVLGGLYLTMNQSHGASQEL